MTGNSTAAHTAGPWKWHPKSGDQEHNGSIYSEPRIGHAYAIAMQPRYVTDEQWAADARLIAAAPETAKQRDDLLEALKQIRLWLAEEGCDEPLELADSALRAAGITDVACPSCHGYGEWDEGPLPARSSTQIDPEYRQVKCPDCDATGRVALTAKEPA